MATLLSLLMAIFGGVPADGPPPRESPNMVLGIQIGVPLASQFAACPMEGVSPVRQEDRHCLAPSAGSPKVLPSRNLFAELGRVEFRVRELGGVVVEVEAEFPPQDAKRVERYLRQRLGPPAESEKYERDSRLRGSRNFWSHSWRGAGATLHFLEMGQSDMGVVRGFSDRWAEEERERRLALERPPRKPAGQAP